MDLAANWPVVHRVIASSWAAGRRAPCLQRHLNRGFWPLVAVAMLAGCAIPAIDPDPATVVAVTPVASGDPLIAFASGAATGAEGGRFRLTRSYSAASGAECREVQESAGVDRLRLVCRDPNGQWREARPLLSSVSQRP